MGAGGTRGERRLDQHPAAAAPAALGQDPHAEGEDALGRRGVKAERADELAFVLEHEEELAVPLDAGAEALLEVLDRGARARSPASGLRRRRPSSRGRSPRSRRSSPASLPSPEHRPAPGQSSRRASTAKACDQASGVVERGTPVRASTRSGSSPAGVAARRSAATRRRAAARSRRRCVAPRGQARKAPGAPCGRRGPGVGLPPVLGGARCRSGCAAARVARPSVSSVRRTGRRARAGEGPHSPGRRRVEPDPLSPASRTSPRRRRPARISRIFLSAWGLRGAARALAR